MREDLVIFIWETFLFLCCIEVPLLALAPYRFDSYVQIRPSNTQRLIGMKNSWILIELWYYTLTF